MENAQIVPCKQFLKIAVNACNDSVLGDTMN